MACGEGGNVYLFLIKTNLASFSLGQKLVFGLPCLVVGVGANELPVPLFPSLQPCGLAHV